MLDKINPCKGDSGKIGDLIYTYLMKPINYGTDCTCCHNLRWFALGLFVMWVFG